MGSLHRLRAVIADGQTTSNEVDLSEYRLVAIQLAASVEGATLSFLGRASVEPDDALSAVAVVDNAGNAVSVTATDDRYIVCDAEPLENLRGVRYLTIVSASSETGAQTIFLVCESRL